MSANAERYLIEICGGDQAPAELPRSGMLVIGSSSEKAGFCVSGQGVADVHCAIGKTKDGSFAIKDLGSEFGTMVNGARVTQARLNPGDDILVGSMRLKIVAASSSSATAAPSPPEQPQATPTSRPQEPAPHKKRATRSGASKSSKPRIPGYQVNQLLGRGAMGEVYLSVQESLDREVALKVLSKEHEQDAAFVDSFQAEARSAAALNHPNVVTVHDVGEASGVHYLTMEYMDRGCLEERVAKEGPLPWPIVLAALKDAASGLVYAESRGIVHRDIKPANLMQNHTGVTKIADLGLATSISQEDAPDGERKLFGTPHFISPEQVKGEKADCRSDLYSLGSTAYRLLTGRTPFEGANTREILRAKLRGETTPIRTLAADVPATLEALVSRLMALDPADRFPSASALLREIEGLQTGSGNEGGLPAPADKSKLAKVGIPAGLVAVALIVIAAMMGDDTSEGLASESRQPPPQQDDSTGSPFIDTALELGNEELLPVDETESLSKDDDIEERLFETAAENALLKLGQRDLSPAERRDALRELAREFLGTTAASNAIDEAKEIDNRLAMEMEESAERNQILNSMMASLRQAANLEDPALRPGNSLRAMRAVAGQEALAIDSAFLAERAKLEALVISTGLDQLAVARQELDDLKASGEFDTLEIKAKDLLGRCDLPAFEDGAAPPRINELEALSVELQGLLDSMELLEVEFARNLTVSDRTALAAGLGGGSGIVSSIKQLDFSAAAASCKSLTQEVRSQEAQLMSKNLHERLVSASLAIPILIDNFSSWRRLKVEDPQDSRGKPRDARAISESGLVIDDRGASREVPWSAFGSHTRALGALFSKRLERNYTADELMSIGDLMYFTALAETVNEASEMFFLTDNDAVFTKKEAEELPENFDLAREWIQDEEQLAALEIDRQAADLLGGALLSGSSGKWTTAVGQLEELLIEYNDCLLVRFLSDGSSIQLPR